MIEVLHVHRAERADVLADALGELLATPQADPFATEVVAVPAKGVERWLAQRLAHRLGAAHGHGDGVCAGVSFPAPGALVADATGAVTGVDPRTDPWHPARAVWPLLQVLDGCADEPWCTALTGAAGRPGQAGAGGPGQAGPPGRRLAGARRLAELFAGYALHRPQLLLGWHDGDDDDNGPTEFPAEPHRDGAGEPDPAADLWWQRRLWRLLRASIGRPGPAERLAAACAALTADPGATCLPPRLSVFGPTRLPAAHLAVLDALAAHREVHLWLAHPSPALWARLRPPPAVPRRRADPTAHTVRHPLLSSLGRDVRELQVRLALAVPGFVDHHHRLPDPPPTLLGRLQRELRDDDPPGAADPPGRAAGAVADPAGPEPLDPGPAAHPAGTDRSVQVHACHGAHRQVEVLREVVLGLLAADPTLEPRDVLVMCPDIETFAPLISASFGLGAGEPRAHPGSHPGQRLPVRLADRSLRTLNPLLDTVAGLLELAQARLTASQLLDLLASPPVRRRFRLDDADLDRVRDLVARSGVRWGLDAAQRAPFGLGGFGQNTWSAGLDRLLLGAAMSGADREWLGTALPLEEVESGEVERVGRLAEFVDRLGAVLDRLRAGQPLTAWVAALLDGLDTLTDTTAADAWQDAQARAELAAAVLEAGAHAGTVPLGPADVRSLLAERLRGRPGRANFRTGALTVATLVPMRSVPHRVVCLLGLDDGVFPRAGATDGDDLLARDPLAGERDARSEDRQLLLDAVCAATEHLVVVASGADERTGARRPFAVPVGELLDAVEASAGPAARAMTVVWHPLQPFDARNFTPGALAAAGPFSFDRTELAGALAAAGPKRPARPFLAEPLPPLESGVIALERLVGFLEHPVKGFLSQRVRLAVGGGQDAAADALPVELDGLRTWAIGDRLLSDRLAGHRPDRCRQAEWRRGELPPGALGEALLARLLDDVEQLVAATPVRVSEADDRDVDVQLPDGTRVVGTIGGLHGRVLARVEFSKLAPKQRIRAWVRLLALTAATGEPWQAVTLGRGQRTGTARSTVGPVLPHRAAALLGGLVGLYRAGMRAPLPLPTLGGHAYARTRRGGGSASDALAEALKTWCTCRFPERDEEAHVRVWGQGAGAEVLTGEAGEPGGEPTRFGGMAMLLWDPLLAAEEVDHP